jgi:hypothetical protein
MNVERHIEIYHKDEPDCRARLCVAGREVVKLGDRLLHQREHDREVEIALSQKFVGDGKAVVGEVAGKDGCQMKLSA